MLSNPANEVLETLLRHDTNFPGEIVAIAHWDRLKEHKAPLNALPSGNLAQHVSRWECSLVLDSVQILGRFREKFAREILEVFPCFQLGK